ncbi:MAG: GIN domain-containing protein [Jejuia sp.]
MKTIFTFIICFASIVSQAQIKGNKQIETRSFSFNNVSDIKIDLYAKITIDPSAKAGLSITADSNLFDFIDKEVVDGKVHFNQIKWIQPSEDIIIKIGAPHLKHIFHDTHDVTKVINANMEYLNITAPIGKIILEGKTEELRLGNEMSTIDASKLIANKVYANIWSRGTVKVMPIELLWAKISKKGRLIYDNEPNKKTIKYYNDQGSDYEFDTVDPKFINFKIKNNSGNRNQFFVIGPKPDGSTFSYGFPMMPQATRKENWSTGTKVYKVNKLGFRNLLVTIVEEDENKTVRLFD